jgi:(2Fe-2S) ferredoxin
MSKETEMTDTRTPDASGPIVALCAGHRCEALHRLADDRTGTDRLRTTVSGGRGAVLVTTPCLGACASGAVAAIARRDGATGTTGPSVWLGGVDNPEVLDALLGWIRAGGPPPTELPTDDVPETLTDAILGVGHPIRASGAAD